MRLVLISRLPIYGLNSRSASIKVAACNTDITVFEFRSSDFAKILVTNTQMIISQSWKNKPKHLASKQIFSQEFYQNRRRKADKNPENQRKVDLSVPAFIIGIIGIIFMTGFVTLMIKYVNLEFLERKQLK